MKEQEYLIWSFEHDGWWKPEWKGYTEKLSQAGVYSYAEALKICLNANKYQKENKFPNEAMVPIQPEVK